MICRIWHGWTTPANADAYEQLLRAEIFHGIAERGITGYQGIQLLRRPEQHLVGVRHPDVVRFLRGCASLRRADHEVAVEPPPARALLHRFDARSAHYEVRQQRGTA